MFKLVPDLLSEALDRVGDHNIRLAVTGLSRSGKTLFTASLVHYLKHLDKDLLQKSRKGIQIYGASIRAPGSQSASLFPYKETLACLSGSRPRWPDNTRNITEIRVEIRYAAPARLIGGRRQRRLTIDLIDYPGEWLLDLPLLEKGFDEWNQQAMALAGREPRASLAADWLGLVRTLRDDDANTVESNALRKVAGLYRDYLRRCRSEARLQFVQPGRFLIPGDLEGTQLLDFFPLPTDGAPPQVARLMAERYEAYKKHVVKPFYQQYFSSFDRQILLVDLLTVLNGGQATFQDTRLALDEIMRNFSFGHSNWFNRLFSPKIDRVLFAATKADRVNRDQYAAMREFLSSLLFGVRDAIEFETTDVRITALAAIRCTEDIPCRIDGQPHTCIRGVPEGGDEPRNYHPGSVPCEPPDDEEQWRDYGFVSFRPPLIGDLEFKAIPQRNLEEVLNFLIHDKLT